MMRSFLHLYKVRIRIPRLDLYLSHFYARGGSLVKKEAQERTIVPCPWLEDMCGACA